MSVTGEHKPQNKLENFETDAVLDVMESWCGQLERQLGVAPKRQDWAKMARRTALAVCCLFILLDMTVGNPNKINPFRYSTATAAVKCPMVTSR